MNGKPTVALALSRRVYDMMFDRADLARLGEVASIVGPTESGAAGEEAPLLRDALVALAGWGSARFDESLLANAPKLKLIAYTAGSLKVLVTDAVYDRGIRVTTAAAANAPPVAETTVAMMAVMLKRIPWLLPAGGDKQ